MSGFALRKNMTFEWDGTAFRIDRLPPDGSVLIERMSDGQFSTVSRQQLLQAFGAGKIRTLSQEKNQPTVPDRIFMEPLASIPQHLQKEARPRHQYLQAIADAGVAPSSKIGLRDVVTECAELIGDPKPPSRATIFRWYRKFIQQNDTRALIPKYHRRGNRQLRQPKLILDMTGQAIEEAFKLSPRASMRQVYHRLVGKIEQHNRKLLPIEHLKVPSERTVHRMVQRLEAFQLVAYRDGKLAASKKFRRVLNSVETSRILERVEVDHTPLDLFLIDEVSGLPLGRPTLTVMIDHFSRMLLGYYLSYGNPSTAAVMGALRHAILPKELSHAAIPGLTIENQWECYGRPDVMVLDNGMEFHSNDLESVAFDLDIRLQYCPKHEPRFKGVVERYLKTINYFFAQQLPGTSMARLYLRGDYDPIKHAVLTFAEFNHLFQKWVVDVYAATPHRGLHGRCPRDAWKDGLQHREPELPESLQALQRRIGQVQERRLRPDGIQLNGIRYNGDNLTRILQSYGPGVKVRVLFDPNDLGEIHVWGPDDEAPVQVLALDQKGTRGLTLTQNELIRTAMRESGAEKDDPSARQRAHYEIAQAVDQLMASRKQRDRRRAANIRGANSHQPEKSLSPPPQPSKPVLKVVAQKLKPTAESSGAASPPMPLLPAFQLKRKQGGTP